MKELALRASKFVSLSKQAQDLLINSGAIVINDVFYNYFMNREKLVLLYGSYGSGKSKFAAQDLVEKCKTDKYFKCFYGRKVYDNVRNSNFDELCTYIEERGLQHEFTYSRADNSSMIITHKKTRNKFIPFGADKSDKLKSIKDPTVIWCEELDQFTIEDFRFLFSRLRTERADLQFVGTMNTDRCTETHWARKVLFPETIAGTPTEDVEKLKPLKIFANYTDNYFINHEQYLDTLRLIAAGNEHVLKSISAGAWGVSGNDNPFFYAYQNAKHYTRDTYVFCSDYTLDIAFDFNKSPCVAVIGQHNRRDITWKVYDVIVEGPTNKYKCSPLAAVCKTIYAKYVLTGIVPNYRIRVTGDATGKNGSADREEAVTFYHTIMRELKLRENQLFIRGANISHVLSGEFINAVLYALPQGHLLLHDVLELEDDIIRAYPDDDRTLNKAKEKLGLHVLDAWRYLMDMWFCLINGMYTNDIAEIRNNIISINRRIEKLNQAA